ncbi:CybS-domain-containing protein [Pelagophyceae sp. CCMP2097]|nr:CybS-domain-containing protein [Pelagophyceae sp. CCMP2097]|mmetsp:Transcript_26310/g.88442  ORF Transcript_26310/g.88442 Transcript_26310/m.88442 type:complete len:127 (-) Transcript_26310:218-598(-)
MSLRAQPVKLARRGINIVAADEGKLATSYYHAINLGLLGLTPVALAAPSALNFPLDMALAVFFPLHAHIGMNYVISDYVPKFLSRAAIGPARAVMLGVTSVTVLGLFKLNVEGPGITKSLKQLWYK